MRLNRYIASSGICSRRKADELISNGNVKINGALCTELGVQVGDGDVVSVNGREIRPTEKKIYIALNKPTGYVTTMNDDRGRKTVADLVTDVPERLFPVGRLDYNTSGLLIMTNDGKLAQRLSHPSHKVYKTYIAEVEGIISDARLSKLRKGIDIDGHVTAPAKVRLLKQKPGTATVEISIREGRNRQVRKMFSAVGNRVRSLERTAVGDILLGRLLQGHYRKLTKEEIDYLMDL